MRVIRAGLIVLLAAFSQIASANIIEVKLHYIGPTEGSVWQGVQQGLTEANIQGEFLGQVYSLHAETAAELAKTQDEITAILVAGDEQQVLAIANKPEFAHIPVFNLVSDSDVLRSACVANLLNISPSNKMKQDALAQWLAKNPDSKAHVQGWHESFKKFAASQLNSRFKKAHGVIMDDDAWSGWAAVKLLSDTVARLQSDDASAMLNYLRNDIAFDGHQCSA